MNLVLVGLNHKTAPVEIRERVAFSDQSMALALETLQRQHGFREGMIVSTCNRVEIIAGDTGNGHGHERLKHFLYQYHQLKQPTLEKYLYVHHSKSVIEHVFRVASSLDSMVVGEAQILGQIKQAYTFAREAGAAGSSLNRLMPHAFFVARRVRNETLIARSAVSISSAALELARKIFAHLEDKAVFLLGAGKMSELAVRNLADSADCKVLIANRTPARSQRLAERFGGTVVPFAEKERYLIHSDIVIVSTDADEFLLTREQVQEIIRARKYNPLFIIDISVPRNVDPGVNEVENVFLYDIDDLESVISANRDQRKKEADIAEEIIQQEVEKYMESKAALEIGPLMGSLRAKLEAICLEELDKQGDSLDAQERERLEQHLRKAARRIAHPLILDLKKPDKDLDRRYHKIQIVKDLFNLDDDS